MITLRGLADDDATLRDLDIEVRSDEVFLHAHPPGNEAAGDKVLVPLNALSEAIRGNGGELAGVTPTQRKPKRCTIEHRPEGLQVKIETESGASGWWVTVRRDDLGAALSK